jgi:hypothetical protein
MADPNENKTPPDSKSKKTRLENDERFPSGPWEGFFLMSHTGRKRHMMELILKFSETRITGEGRDFVGDFILRGRYDLATGHCLWNKKYVKRHEVGYDGYNEGKGIFGKWEILDTTPSHGGFLIWPKGMGDPTNHRKREVVEEPAEAGRQAISESELVTVSAENLDQSTESFDN